MALDFVKFTKEVLIILWWFGHGFRVLLGIRDFD